MIIRSINDKHFSRVVEDFRFLVDRIHAENGELDLRLRHNYFNLYYKGNSLAKIRVDATPYAIEIHEVFAEPHLRPNAEAGIKPVFDERRFGQPVRRNGYCTYRVEAKNLHPFLSKTNLSRLYREIVKRNYGEEITFEQMLITDNLDREDLVIIDRQVQGGPLGRTRIDLLGLRQMDKGSNRYSFVILEVKLGNNPELSYDVGKQLQGYIDEIVQGFEEFRGCYERTYAQMKTLGLLQAVPFDAITIVKPVNGLILVGGYSGLAKAAQKKLLSLYPEITVKLLQNRI